MNRRPAWAGSRWTAMLRSSATQPEAIHDHAPVLRQVARRAADHRCLLGGLAHVVSAELWSNLSVMALSPDGSEEARQGKREES